MTTFDYIILYAFLAVGLITAFTLIASIYLQRKFYITQQKALADGKMEIVKYD